MPRPPSSGPVTSGFGMRIHPLTGTLRMHYGADRGGGGNVAPVTGVITFIGYHVASGFGNVILIREDATGAVWAVAHHASFAPGLKVSQRITEGTYTGPIGMTGAATGPHTHTERRTVSNGQPLSGIATNPESFYGGSGASGGGVTHPDERKTMTSLYRTAFTAAIPMPERIKAHAARLGTPITSETANVFMLCGDSPGTPANVDITQEDTLANQWAADHTGTLESPVIPKAARRLAPAVFVAKFDAYLTPLAPPSAGAGALSDTDVARIAVASADEAAARLAS